jgi:hypothetical protein
MAKNNKQQIKIKFREIHKYAIDEKSEIEYGTEKKIENILQ